MMVRSEASCVLSARTGSWEDTMRSRAQLFSEIEGEQQDEGCWRKDELNCAGLCHVETDTRKVKVMGYGIDPEPR
jgi:hypothetical protein